MQLFRKKKPSADKADIQNKEDKKPVSAGAATSAVSSRERNLSAVIIRPRITEKATAFAELNIHVFDVMRSATKRDVADAVRMLFGVTPRKINIVHQRPRRESVRSRRRERVVPGSKKAHVFLKKGDTINLV